MSFFKNKPDALLQEERRLLTQLSDALAKSGLDEHQRQMLEDSILQLDDFFLIVVVGEFNAGKSALINALLGEPVLQEGVTPTTTQVHLLRYAPAPSQKVLGDYLVEITAPVPLLRDLSIVDTPGTNAIIREHEVITERFAPRADLVLFVTSADRPFSESERAFMEKLRAWGKKIVLVINKADLLERAEDLEQVITFVQDNARALLGIQPEVFPVSAKQALRAKQGEKDLWAPSRFAALESYIQETLDQTERIRLKLLNPLGVGLRLARQSRDALRQELDILEEDLETIANVERQMAEYQADMQRGFELRMAEIDNLLLDMEQRAREYFDETIRLGRVLDLLNKKRLQEEFQTKVIGDVPQQIEAKVHRLIDWLVENDLRQWQALHEYLARHQGKYEGKILQAPSGFRYDRQRLVETVGERARQIVEGYDKEKEARLLAEGTQAAVAAAAAMEVGAIGLGAVLTAIATTLTADITGIAAASFVAVLGLFIIPARRRQAAAAMHRKVTDLRRSLSQTLRQQFEHSLHANLEQIQETLAPYSRFVRAEHKQAAERYTTLEDLIGEMERLKAQIERL